MPGRMKIQDGYVRLRFCCERFRALVVGFQPTCCVDGSRTRDPQVFHRAADMVQLE